MSSVIAEHCKCMHGQPCALAVIPVCCNTVHLCAWTAIYVLSNYSKPTCHERLHRH